MADQGTAVFDPAETVQLEGEAPEYQETDTPVNEEPETDGAEDAETEATLTEEDVEERIKQAISEREAEWQAQQDSESYKARLSESEKTLSAEAARGITQMVGWATKLVEEGKTAQEVTALINSRAVASLAEPLAAAISTQEYEARTHLLDQYQKKVAPDWRPSPDLVRKMEQARNSRDPRRAFESHMEYLREMVLEVDGPKLVEKALLEREEKTKKAGQLAAKKSDVEQKQSQARPTSGVGGNGAPVASRDVIGNPKVSMAEQRRAFEKLHGFAPDF